MEQTKRNSCSPASEEVNEIPVAEKCRVPGHDVKKRRARQESAPSPSRPVRCSRKHPKPRNFSTQKTMRIAQQLYEGIDIKGSGTVGLITYLRTDSTRISEEADQAARAYVASNYGENYVAEGTTEAKKSAKRIQDAHEAIRPSDITGRRFW